jgi:predicted PurR-regulated permease PerM
LWLQQKKVPSIAAALLIVITMMLVLAVVGAIVGSSISEFTSALPAYQERLDKIVDGALQFLARISGNENSFSDLGELIDPGWAMGMAATILTALQDVLTNTFLILFTMVFILLEVSSAATKAQAAFGLAAGTLDRPRAFVSNLGRYLGIKTVVSVATGITAGLLTWWIGLDFPLLWAMLAFLFNYVPTIGSIIAAVPAVLLAVVQLGPGDALTTALGFLAINMVFGNMIEPRLMGRGVGISPLIIFTGLVLWGWIFGPVGMLLSVPLTMTVKMALESNDRTRWAAILIGSEQDAEWELAHQMNKKKE